ncbi:MAG TPA: hypothetical protein VE197_11725, partial [Mycobacterium sp.]|nr:hypothetical protein [Mycobacterium sp.]
AGLVAVAAFTRRMAVWCAPAAALRNDTRGADGRTAGGADGGTVCDATNGSEQCGTHGDDEPR